MSEIEKFDPSKLMDGVKDRIKATFVGLIPDEKWEEMVKNEIDAFFEPSKVTYSTEKVYSWNTEKVYVKEERMESPFRTIVWGFCKEMTHQILREKIKKDYFLENQSFLENNSEISENLANLIAEATPKAMNEYFKEVSRSIAYSVMNNIK